MIKISDVSAVNPKHVLAVLFDKATLTTKVVFPGGASIASDKSFAETIDLLTIHNSEES